MDVLSVYRGARISAFKARELTRVIQGLPASAALDLIAFSPKKAALLVGKTLKSAIANAENNNELRVDTLVVKEATVGEGPTIKRMKSRARGSSSAICKRTSHIRIVLTDEITDMKTGEPGRGAVLHQKSRILQRVNEQNSKRTNRDSNIQIQPVARFVGVDENSPRLVMGNVYSLEVSINTNFRELLARIPTGELLHRGQIAYDVFVEDENNILSVKPKLAQSVLIHANGIEPAIFSVQPLRQLTSKVLVTYIYNGALVAKLTTAFSVI